MQQGHFFLQINNINMPTPQEIGIAYDKAVAAGNIAVANELAEVLNSIASNPSAQFEDLPPPADSNAFNRNLSGDVIKPTLKNFRTGLPQAEPNMEGMATGIRYGLPLGVAVVTAPPTAGTSIGAYLAALGAGSLINAGTSGLTEGAADLLEGKDLSLRRMASASIRGSTPFLSRGGAAFMMAANTATSIGTNEIARFMENDPENNFDVNKQSNLMRFGVPVVSSIFTSGLSSRAQSQVAAEKLRKEISDSRFGGPVVLSEVKTEYANFEANRLASGLNQARANVMDMDVNIGPAIMSAFPEAGSSKELSDDLAAMVGKLSETQKQWKAASAAYQESMGAYNDAVARQAENAPELLNKAQKAALEVEKAR
jgi:hypothetical protein